MTAARLGLAAVVVAVALAAVSTGAEGQVLLASRPHSGLVVTPLFVVADLASGAADVPVEVLFSLMIPPDQSALELEQDLFLLWPGEVVGTDAGGRIALPRDVAAQVSVIARGRVRLQAQRHYESPADTEVIETGGAVRVGRPHRRPMGRARRPPTSASRGTRGWPTRRG